MTWKTRADLEAAIWRHAHQLTTPDASKAMDAILRTADAWARDQAERIIAERNQRLAAGLYAPDDAELTEQRRRVLDDALRAAS